MIRIRTLLAALAALFLAIAPLPAQAGDYDTAVTGWTSYKEVAAWLSGNFQFDTARHKAVVQRIKTMGPSGLLAHAPAQVYADKAGYCVDAAALAKDALARVNPAYEPRWVFVKNKAGPSHHWVTSFTVDGKLYVMDFGAGPEWRAMMGVHGPYDSLDQYAAFLSGLTVPGFALDSVAWREMPGQQD